MHGIVYECYIRFQCPTPSSCSGGPCCPSPSSASPTSTTRWCSTAPSPTPTSPAAAAAATTPSNVSNSGMDSILQNPVSTFN